MSFEQLKEGLDLTSTGAQDASGKTPLDRAIEEIRLDTEGHRNEFTLYLVELLPELAAKGPEFVKLGRYLIRRTRVKDRRLVDTLRLLLASEPAKNIEVRLWLLLILMDLGFPPTIAHLNADESLRRAHVGEWLTLVSANESYADVKDAFVRAAADGLLDERLLVLKVDAVRRQFGNRLFDFLTAVVPALALEEREVAVSSVKKMYGLDVAASIKPIEAGRNSARLAASSKTIRLLEALRADAERRAESRNAA